MAPLALVALLPWAACGIRLTEVDLTDLQPSTEAEAAGFSSGSAGRNAALPAKPECEQYKDFVIFGRNISLILTTVCRIWPGPFPVNKTSGLLSVLNKTFGPGGLLEALQGLKDERDDWFCTRHEVWRPIVYNRTMQCDQDGGWSPNGDWGDGWESCESNRKNLTCQCTEETEVPGTADSRRAEKCETKKACYDHCPFGYRAAWLQINKPVCTSVCADSTHPIPCGMGCANSAWHCALLAREQAGEVANGISWVISLVLVNPLFHEVVNTVVDMVNFVFHTITALVKATKKVFHASDSKEHLRLAMFISFFQFNYEVVSFWVQELADRNERLREAFDFFWDIFGSGLSGGTLRGIANIFLNAGPKGLTFADAVADQFQWPMCKVASRDVLFTIDRAGVESIVGPWVEQGRFHGKPRYVRLGSRREKMEWNRWAEAWCISYLDTTTVAGKYFRWMGLGWRRVYKSKGMSHDVGVLGVKNQWVAEKHGALPVPSIEGVLDDGDGERLRGGVQMA